jgi:hypothetical protein
LYSLQHAFPKDILSLRRQEPHSAEHTTIVRVTLTADLFRVTLPPFAAEEVNRFASITEAKVEVFH